MQDGQLEKRDHDLADQRACGREHPEVKGDGQGQGALDPQLDELPHPLAVLPGHLRVIVQKAQSAQDDRRQ